MMILSFICKVNYLISGKKSRDAQVSQAKRMIKRSHADLTAGEVEGNVVIVALPVDKGSGGSCDNSLSLSTTMEMTCTPFL